jgi:hypothetical protein
LLRTRFHTARVNSSPARRVTSTTNVTLYPDRITAAQRTEKVCHLLTSENTDDQTACAFRARQVGYWSSNCADCRFKKKCTTGPERRIPRWEHEHVLEAVQERLDADPHAVRRRRETVEHSFGTMKARMGATHVLMKTLPRVASEMALHVLAYNLTRVLNIVGVKGLMVAIRA